VLCRVHCPIEYTLGFNRSHWMLPSGECLHCIAAAAAMVDDFGQKHKTTTKTIFSHLPYGRPKPNSMRILGPEMDPLLTSSMQQASKCKRPQLELKSSATFLSKTIKRCERTKIEKVIKRFVSWGTCEPLVVKLL